MNPLLILVATAALGVEVGWEPLPGGGYEYTIQIEPELLKVLEQGHDEIFSEVPAGIDVRRYRVMVGVGKLRRENGPLATAGSVPADVPPAAAPAARQAAPPSEPFSAAPLAAAASDPFGTPPSDPVDSERALDADLGQRSPGGAAVAPAGPPATGNSSLGNSTAAAQDPYGVPPASNEPPPQTAPPAASLATAPDAGGPAMPDFGNSATKAPPAKAPAGSALAADPTALEPIPANPWRKQQAAVAESQGPVEAPPVAETKNLAQAPAKLPSEGDVAGPIQKATFDKNDATAQAEPRDTGKPKLDEVPESRPWLPLIAAIMLLGCSIGGNVFLGWVAYDARNRYRNAIAKFRGATA